MKTRCRALLSTLVVLSLPSACLAWGDGGHEMVAYIAYQRLNAKAKAEVDRLLKVAITPKDRLQATTPAGRFMHAAHWPDDVRNAMPETAQEHYADFPFSPDHTPLPDLPEAINVIEALETDTDTLKNSTDDVEKAKALRFLIHFVGDIHQPLHCSTRVTAAHPDGDRGGNSFTVKVTDGNGHKKTEKLHSFWDQGLGTFPKEGVNFAPPPDATIPPAVKIVLAGNSDTDPKIKAGGPENFRGWAGESSSLAVSTAYGNLTNNQLVPSSYQSAGVAVANKRVAWAGYRLANLLNAIYSR